jgi:hypothetical protein
MPVSPTIFPKDAPDNTFIWLLWDKPKVRRETFTDPQTRQQRTQYVSETPFDSSGNVFTIARVRSSWAINSDKPDETWPDYDIDRDDRLFYTEKNAIAVGKRMADWFEYQNLVYTKPIAIVNGKPYSGSIFPQNWGYDTNGQTLFKEPEDLVMDSLSVSDFSDFSRSQEIVNYRRQNIKYIAGFCENGIRKSRENRTIVLANVTYTLLGLSNWVRRVAESMKSECDRRGLCYPRYLSLDLENFSPLLFGFVGSDGGPRGSTASSANPEEFPVLYKSSCLRSIQADPRYNTETVWQQWNGRGWDNKTWRDAFVAAGSPVDDRNTFYASSNNNVNFIRRISPFITKMQDYALFKTIYEPLKEVFPGILCGNYYVYLPMSTSARDPNNSNSWLHYPEVNLPSSLSLRADYQSSVCYSPNLTDFPYRYSPNRFNSKFTMAIGATGHPYGRTNEQIYRSFIKAKIRSTTVGNSKKTPTLPWLEFPGSQIGSEIENRVFHLSTVDDLYDIMFNSYLNGGVRVYQFFNPFMNSWSQSLVGNSVSLFDRFRNLVQRFPNPAPDPFVIPVSRSFEDEISGTGCTGPTVPNQIIPRINVITPAEGEFVEIDTDEGQFTIRLEYENFTANWLIQPPCERAETLHIFLQDTDGNTHEEYVEYGTTKIQVPISSFAGGEGSCLLAIVTKNHLGANTNIVVGPPAFYFNYQT